MYKKWLAVLFAAMVSTCAASGPVKAAGVNFDQGVNVKKIVSDLKTAESSVTEVPLVPAAADKRASAKNWTIMVYINAKNNLESFGLKNVNQMEMVGSSSKVNVVVELGRIAGYDSSDGDWTGSRRYLIKKDNNMSHISSPVLQEFQTVDMGDWNHLVDFAQWAQTNFPAQHYMLIVWNHGSGWSKRAGLAIRGISYDEETGNHISTEDLGNALAQIGKIDVYGSDACLMQMASIDYQIKDYVDYIVGSEETEPGDGYTYNTFLKPLVANPDSTPDQVAAYAVNSYADHYVDINQDATQSAVIASAMVKFNALASGWADMVMKAKENPLVKSAKNNALSFADSSSKDLYHFVQLITEGTQNSALAQKGTELMTFIEKELVIVNRTVGSNYGNAHGIAIYIPSSGYSSEYGKLAWAKDGKWDEFAKWIAALK